MSILRKDRQQHPRCGRHPCSLGVDQRGRDLVAESQLCLRRQGSGEEGWREGRRDHGLVERVSQSPSRALSRQVPTAYVASVVYSWMQQEETARFEPLIRVVDSLSTHWCAAALERNWLSQSLQASVPAGCTPIVQPTDTGFAGPAKVAGRAEHERQKSLFVLKADSEGAKPSFKCAARATAPPQQTNRRSSNVGALNRFQ